MAQTERTTVKFEFIVIIISYVLLIIINFSYFLILFFNACYINFSGLCDMYFFIMIYFLHTLIFLSLLTSLVTLFIYLL